MRIPDSRKLTLHKGVLPEPFVEDNRLVVWLPGPQDGGFQSWERIANVARQEIVVRDGFIATAAVSVRVRRRIRGLLRKFFQRFQRKAEGRTWILPNGETADQFGERATDLLLIWTEDGTTSPTEAGILARWPQSNKVEQLGTNLFLVRGIQPTGGNAPAPGADIPPRQAAEHWLAAARQTGDRTKEAAALAELGTIALQGGDPSRAAGFLEEALTIVRQLGERAAECDVLGNLGMAVLIAGDCPRALATFQDELAAARSINCLFATKMALEHLGLLHARLRDPATALPVFDQALGLARQLGDRRQEADLLWLVAIQQAELERRDAAIASAEASVQLRHRLGKPDVGWFAEHLHKYRTGQTEGAALPAMVSGAADMSDDALGVSTLAGIWGTPGASASPTASGPGLLRMAVTATKAMAQFIGSGCKKVSPQDQQARVRTCEACEHHTGLRCRLCGCFTSTKAWLPYEDCPLKKWPPTEARPPGSDDERDYTR